MARGPIGWLADRLKLNPVQTHIHSREPFVQPDANVDFRAAYDQIEVVHRAVEMIVSGCVEVPFAFSGEGPLKKLNKLLNDRPNPFEDRVRLMRRAYFDLLIDGNAFFYYDGSHLYVLPANDVEIVTDPKTFVKGYIFLIHGGGTSSYSAGRQSKKQTIEFSANEIIHIKEDNDESIFRGKSRIKSLSNIINIYNALLKFQRQFFKNNAVPGIVLTTDSVLNSKIKERLLQSWRSSYATIFEGSRSPAILDGGLKIDRFSDVNFQSLDFENSIERLEQDMAKALGVPYVLMKSGNNANISANQVLFYEHTILPIVSMFASAFAHYFNSARITPDKSVITALQPDLRTQSQYYVSLVNSGIITADEARAKLGFGALNQPETNAIRIPQNITGSASNPDVGGRPRNEEVTDIPEDEVVRD
jgi:HK97 family phage portal protein